MHLNTLVSPLFKISNRLVETIKPLSLACLLLSPIANSTDMADLPLWQNTVLPNFPSLRGSAIIDASLWVSGNNNTVFVSQDA
jgi:hypothetical protein